MIVINRRLLTMAIMAIGPWLIFLIIRIPAGGVGPFTQEEVQRFLYIGAVTNSVLFPLFLCGQRLGMGGHKPEQK